MGDWVRWFFSRLEKEAGTCCPERKESRQEEATIYPKLLEHLTVREAWDLSCLGFPWILFIYFNAVIAYSECISIPRGVHYSLKVYSGWRKVMVVVLHWFILGLYILFSIYSTVTCAITWGALFTNSFPWLFPVFLSACCEESIC